MIEERLRVLVIDDDDQVREPLREYLGREFGYSVDAAAGGQEALSLVRERQGQYDVALIDEVLGAGPDGIETMQQLRALYPAIEAIIFTGYDTASRRRAIRAGAFRYLQKPLDLAELAMLIRTAGQQVRLREIGEAILSERDPKQVLASIISAASSLALADEAAIVLQDPATGELEIHAKSFTTGPQWQRHFKDQALSRDIIRSGRSVLVPDTAQDERVEPALLEAGFLSFAGLPIPGPDRSGNLGALYVYSRKLGRLEAWGTVALLQTLAGQAGLALTNAQAFQQARRHADHMAALVQAGRGLTRATSVEEQLALAWGFVREQLRVSTFFVALYDKDSDTASFPLFFDLDRRQPVAARVLGDDADQWGLTGWVVKRGEELHWSTFQERDELCDARDVRPTTVGDPCQSCFCLPLRAGSDLVGVLSIQSYDPHAFDNVLLNTIRALGSHLVVALENTRLFAAEAQRRRHAETLRETALTLTTTLERRETFERILSELQKVVPYDSASVQLLRGDRLEIIGARGFPDVSSILGLSFPVGDHNPNSEVVGRQGWFIVADAPAVYSDFTLEPHDQAPIRGWLGVPMIVSDELVGMIALDKHEPGFYTDEHAELAQTFATQAAVAIENARLYDETQQRAQNLETLQDLALAVNSSLDLEGTLEAACEAATKFFAADHSGLVLFEPGLDRGQVRAEFPARGIVGTTIPVQGVGPEERLVEGREPLVVHSVAAESSLGPVQDILLGFDIQSVLIVPVIGKEGNLLGSFSVDAIGHTREFTREEVSLCEVFAAHVAVAIENARMFSQLTEANEWNQAFIESAQDAVITIDQGNRVTVYNRQAEEMFGWTAEEMLGQTVAPLYVDPGQARQVLELVNQEGKVTGWTVELKHQDGSHIPALLSAAMTVDSDGRPTGQAGVIHDLRQVALLEDRLRALIEVGRAVSSVLKPSQVLERVVRLAVDAFPEAECGAIHLYDEGTGILSLKANTRDYGPAAIAASYLEPGKGIAGWVFQQRQPVVVEDAQQDPRYSPVEHSEVPQHRSLMCVPLEVRSRVIGTLSLDNAGRTGVFAAEDLALLSTFADQTAVAIENARLYEQANRRGELLAALDEASRHIRAEREIPALLHEIVRLAAQLAGCQAAALFINRPQVGQLELSACYGLPDGLLGGLLSHREGLVGLVAREGASRIVAGHWTWPERESIFGDCQFQVAAAVPLELAGTIEAVLLVAQLGDPKRINPIDVEILERFATQATIALRTARLMTREQRVLGRLAFLHQISDYVQSIRDLDRIYHVVATGVTAGYGLGLNRAALLLLDKRGEHLVGRMGLGHLTKEEAKSDWAVHHAQEREDFGRYLELLERDALPTTPVGRQIQSLRLPVTALATGPFARALDEGRCMLPGNEDLRALPPDFVDAFAPALPLVIAPLVSRGRSIGILVADNKFTRAPITPEDQESLMTVLNTAAVAIENVELYEGTRIGQERLRAFYEASNELVSSPDVEVVVQNIVKRARVAAQANGVSMILIDEEGQVRKIVTAGMESPVDRTEIIRPEGLSTVVVDTGRYVVIEDADAERDRVNPSVFWRDIHAAFCLPVTLEGEHIGVMWFHYEEPRRFAGSEIEAVQLYVNQAALAYDSARRIKELEHMRHAAETLAGAAGLEEVLERIVSSARAVLEADSAAIWSYDDVRDRFIPGRSVSSGIPDPLWQEFLQEEPHVGRTAYTVMERDWVGVSDMSDEEQYGFVGDSTRRLLGELGVQSFQGISLTVGTEKLGVLYVDYEHRRAFQPQEQETARTFANHAALALKKAKLLEQLANARDAAKMVAQVTALEDLPQTLYSIVHGTREALGCDAVTLFTFDQEREEFGFPPAMAGVWDEGTVVGRGEFSSTARLRNAMLLDQPYEAEDAPNDWLMQGPFVRRERIKSSMSMPLAVGDEHVGVMFINYRSRHRFTDDEVANIELFASQAAVAIRNAQLYQAREQHAQALQAIQDSSAALSAVLDPEELLPMIAERAASIFRAPASSLMLWDKQQESMVIRAAQGLGEQYVAQQRISRDTVEELRDRLGLVPQVHEIDKQPLGRRGLVDGEALFSVLATPLVVGGRLLGILNVYSRGEARRFDEREKELAAIFANHAAIAVQNANAYEELKQTKGLVGARTAVAWMGMSSSAWRHAADKHALTIREQTQLLRQQIEQGLSDCVGAKVYQRLDRIERLATQILEKPITPPLSTEEGVEEVSISSLVGERASQLWQGEPHSTVELRTKLELSDSVTVYASPAWLRRAFDILADNAVAAVADQPVRQVVVGTRRVEDGVEITVTDTGPGIPEEIESKIGLEVIERTGDSEGMGVGLLMAQTILQTYGGEIRVKSTGQTGTIIAIWLPVEGAGL